MRADLVTDDMEFTPKCEAALVHIFNLYDKDKDGALNDQEIQEFSMFTNGKKFTEEELAEIREHLDCRESDNALLKGGFLQLYSLQTNSGDDDETWKDLKKHGFNDNLELEEPTGTVNSKPLKHDMNK
ncbi:hypothetical protein GGI15_003667 [Coemansia interrupta]|uniref:EF-hand domain-containing protein n=1 Tax=Coemansia interrupta TaxID=1126814 RepID=A0A9W8HBC2_9FUNG|nr:hypothetical protein GGI15_003667 [Coemansia interrupta]